MDIRLLRPSDIPHVQQTNITNLPENYFCKYYLYHALSWPQLSYVAVDVSCCVTINIFSASQATHVLDDADLVIYPGLPAEEDAIRLSEDCRLCARKNGGRPARWHTSWPHNKSERDANASPVGAGGEVDAAKSYVNQSLHSPVHLPITYACVLTTAGWYNIAERAMCESYNAVYVSLHVRVSNVAALSLYKSTLGFKVVGTEAKYYADGEDAHSMRKDLEYLRHEALDSDSDVDDEAESSVGKDEGDAVGSAGKSDAGDGAEGKKKEKKRKVKVGRGLGVGELVERNEATQTNGD